MGVRPMTTAADLAASDRGYVVAPAGCGKTELIARAIAGDDSTRQLVLTHTHAGVRALRSRLVRYGVSRRSFTVDTIAGFALRYACGYPEISGLSDPEPRGAGWGAVYGAAARVLEEGVGRVVAGASYDGVYVDEYQDCTQDQHQLVASLADSLPCRVLGDPLQGIFGFAGTLVDWETEIPQFFEELPSLSTPWRWLDTNPELGEWLLEVRDPLMSRKPLDTSSAPVRVGSTAPDQQVLVCHQSAETSGSIVGIRKWARDAHTIASKLEGRFTSMEEMDCKDLHEFSELLDHRSGPARAAALLDFAETCMTKVDRQLGDAKRLLRKGTRLKPDTGSPTHDIEVLLNYIADTDEVAPINQVLDALRTLPGVKTYRRELLAEMKRAVGAVEEGAFASLAEATWTIRDQGRHRDRRLEQRLISRTLLVKGLEFEHCIILNADELESRDLYVAMTRGSTALTVLSSSTNGIVRYKGSR